MSAHENHHEAIREEYKKQAPHWAKRGISTDLRWVVNNLELRPHFVALDVAAGTGLLARAIAPYVERVVASDITPEMQSLGREEADREGTANVAFEHGVAEDLPYPDSSFDMTVTRFSLHHFLQPEAVISQMLRVCRSGGRLAVIDMVSPEDEELAARYNVLERLRDRTHTRALSAREINGLVEDAGAEITGRYSREVEVEAGNWLDSAQVEPGEREQILDAMNNELQGGRETGLRPFLRDGELMFMHAWEMVVAEKSLETT